MKSVRTDVIGIFGGGGNDERLSQNLNRILSNLTSLKTWQCCPNHMISCMTYWWNEIFSRLHTVARSENFFDDKMVQCVFLKKNLWDISSFRGATVTPVGDVCPGFQSAGESLACFLACVILRFTSGMTPADCIEASMEPSLFNPHTCRHVHKHWWKFGSWTHDLPCHTQ